MKLTAVHEQYWARRHAPGWAVTQAARKAPARDVLPCVNEHAGVRDSNAQREANNLCSLLRLVRKNQQRGARPPGDPQNLIEYLEYLVLRGDSDKRRTLARRWLRRYTRALYRDVLPLRSVALRGWL